MQLHPFAYSGGFFFNLLQHVIQYEKSIFSNNKIKVVQELPHMLTLLLLRQYAITLNIYICMLCISGAKNKHTSIFLKKKYNKHHLIFILFYKRFVHNLINYRNN